MTLTRRKAIVFAAGGGAAYGLEAWAGRRGKDGESAPLQFAPVSRTGWALGSKVSMTVAGLPHPQAERALAAAFAELETVEQVMSLYRPDSQICRLNRTGELRDPHPYLVQVLRAAEATSRRTAGAFDVTVQPLWELYSSTKKQGRLPRADELAAARAKIGWWAVESDSDHLVRLHGAGRAITLNGLAQGFATDRAVAALKAQGVEHALVNAGEVGARGGKPGGESWTVSIQHPREADSYVSLAGLVDRSLSTSGDYETRFSDDFRQNHIFDPRTGDSPPELASVSIVAPEALKADGLSTAAMVLGLQRTLELVARLPGVDALLVTKSGRTIATTGFPALSTT